MPLSPRSEARKKGGGRQIHIQPPFSKNSCSTIRPSSVPKNERTHRNAARPCAVVHPKRERVVHVWIHNDHCTPVLFSLSFGGDFQAIAVAFRLPVTPNPPFRSQSQSEASRHAAPPLVSVRQ